MPPKRKELSLKEKVELIKASPGRSQRQLAEQFSIGKTQVQCILKRKAEYMTAFKDNRQGDRKRFCYSSQLDAVDDVTWQWFQRARALNIPVSGPMIQEKALQFAKSLGVQEFKASNGWLMRFRRRHNIAAASICGERGSVSDTAVTDWKEKLPSIIDGYSPRDLYNMDESGLFFRALPDKTLHVRGDNCTGGKRSKERITVMLCVNAVGEFERPLVIGRAEHPRCFKNVPASHLPVMYRANRKAWMNSVLYEEWLTQFNRRMRRQGRKVILFLDNAPSHPRDLQDFSHVKVVFLPANTTSVLQPLDQGIIQCVKTQYRKCLLRPVLSQMETATGAEDIVRSVNILDACRWIAAAVKDVRPSTVERCFARCGIASGAATEGATIDSDDEEDMPLSQLLLCAKERGICENPLTDATAYANIDAELATTDPLDNNWESRLLEDIQSEKRPHDVCSDLEDDDSCVVDTQSKPKASFTDALRWASDLKGFMQERGCVDLWEKMSALED